MTRSRFTRLLSRFTTRGSRFTVHGSRFSLNTISVRHSLFAVLAAFLCLYGVAQGQDDSSANRQPATGNREPASEHYTFAEATRDGTGKFYMGRELSQVVGHGAIRWLERPEREVEELPDKVVTNMDLEKDDVVADIGAGSGYFTFRVAEKVPEGKAIAVDINEQMLEFVAERAKERGITNVETLQGTIEDTKLPADTVDLAFMVDAYHEFSHPREMMESIVRGLKPGGRVIWIEYRKEDINVPIKPLHKMTQAQVKKEAGAVGLEFVETRDFLPSQHFMIFRKPLHGAAGR